ncbi:unnamed protein product [Timema podura]|uniref:Checkpoint protein n=1 Tax=Timema podura TaxID=61482 RepID=A0ABN7NI82_TIMPD|nr:unnamed protein product [Timema podura]
MKFRAEMTEVLCMKQFSNIIEILSKFTKHCTIRICHDNIYFIILDDTCMGEHPFVWCVLEQANFFRRYVMVGLNQEFNEIFLEFEPDMMAKSLNFLKASQSAESMTVKLTNKNSPCLTFEIRLTSPTLARMCVQDIPVTVIPHKEWNSFVQPKLPDFDVKIALPSMKFLRNVIERMKTLDNQVHVTASTNGTLVFKVETIMADMATHFKELRCDQRSNWKENHPRYIWLGSEPPSHCHQQSTDTLDLAISSPKTVSVRVDIKKLLDFLSSDQLNPQMVTCNIAHHKMIELTLNSQDVNLHYVLPSIDR